ncbi:GH24364 [Drosophila grimshawi]|uniref:GH24364 n=3 Tax=Drosophila grimshawi TaxID=7222 RepID=B4JMA9_DROGR|nr:GH24364 [Drosophila grimshawi]
MDDENQLEEMEELFAEYQIQHFTKSIELSQAVPEYALSASVDAKMAGRSQKYSRQLCEANCGQRLRYIRERLPTFEILESQVFPIASPEFEDMFDDIVYAPQLYQQIRFLVTLRRRSPTGCSSSSPRNSSGAS